MTLSLHKRLVKMRSKQFSFHCCCGNAIGFYWEGEGLTLLCQQCKTGWQISVQKPEKASDAMAIYALELPPRR